jgi:multidrug efflux pump subunit AcrA (membrane-fusion protein)
MDNTIFPFRSLSVLPMNQRSEFVCSIDEADRLLDRLEKTAQSQASNDVLWQQALEGLRTLTDASATAIFLPIQEQLALVKSCGPDLLVGAIEKHLKENRSGFPNGVDFLSTSNETCWGAVPISSPSSSDGWLLLGFQPAISMDSWKQTRSVAEAFAEICLFRAMNQTERPVAALLPSINTGIRRISTANGIPELRRALVDCLVTILHADRCSLVSMNRKATMLACSGVSEIDSSSPTVHAIENLANQVAEKCGPVVSTLDEISDQTVPIKGADLVSANRVSFRWGMSEKHLPQDVLVLEWQSKTDMLDQIQTMPNFLPIIQHAWQQQLYWLCLPAWVRRSIRMPQRFTRFHLLVRFSKYLMCLGSICAILWILMRPYPMNIAADAHLEPVSLRSVHASADGFVDEIFVEDQAKVRSGQVLAKLRSPSLDFQIEDTLGKLRAIAEKYDGLRVSINQLSTMTADSISSQTKLTSEMLILDTQEKNAREILRFLREEEQMLTLTSPIDGVVMSTELRRELQNRPVRRGDALFRIAALDDDWRLAVLVADRDTRYVRNHYMGKERRVDFLFESLPSEKFSAEVQSIAPSSENLLGKGSFQLVHAFVDRETAAKAHMGAAARVTFHCGTESTWFVWSRPLVEFVQKRTSFFSSAHIPKGRIDENEP